MDDKRIVALFLERDESAVSITMEQYGAGLLRFASRFLKDERDAEECVNETFAKAWSSIPPNRPDDLFAYLAVICRRTAFKMIEKQTAQKRSAELVELTAEMEECLPCPETMDRTESSISETLNEYLETLGRDKRAVFIGRYWYGDSIADISKRTGFSKSKVKSMLHRTREGLRKFLKEKGGSL
ncbi:MAG: RNA polymerase sigma factor [Ruminococcus sp.]|nr:RNA polymerase sigma factor [Ruminococcus sp.]